MGSSGTEREQGAIRAGQAPRRRSTHRAARSPRVPPVDRHPQGVHRSTDHGSAQGSTSTRYRTACAEDRSSSSRCSWPAVGENLRRRRSTGRVTRRRTRSRRQMRLRAVERMTRWRRSSGTVRSPSTASRSRCATWTMAWSGRSPPPTPQRSTRSGVEPPIWWRSPAGSRDAANTAAAPAAASCRTVPSSRARRGSTRPTSPAAPGSSSAPAPTSPPPSYAPRLADATPPSQPHDAAPPPGGAGAREDRPCEAR